MFVGGFRPAIASVFPAQASTAAVPWYLSGGISAANAIAAYQPKGAASLAASYTNLANPGTYNAAPGVAPLWDATNGWDFALANRYLLTGIVPASTWSVLCRFSGLTIDGVLTFSLFGVYVGTSTAFLCQPVRANDRGSFNGRGAYRIGFAATSGVFGFANRTQYYNGASDGITIPAGTIPTSGIPIGALLVGSSYIQQCKYIQAFSIYDTELTLPQMAAVSAAMAAL